MSYIGRQPQIGNFQICDAISTVNNQAAYTMQVGSVNVLPETANHMIVSLNGVIQAPISSYTVSGSTITFAANLVTGDVINFIQILGDVLDLGVPSDDTVTTAKVVDGAITSAKLASGVGGVAGITSSADATAMTITSAEKIGIGETSPLGLVHIKTADSGAGANGAADELVIENGTSGASAGISILSATNGYGAINFGDSGDDNIGLINYDHPNNAMTFFTNGAERMRIDGSGFVLIGTTSQLYHKGVIQIKGAASADIGFIQAGSNGEAINFRNASGTSVGSILVNASSTAYNTSSDYRLKENVNYTFDATTKLKQLKPARFNWIADDTNTLIDGFIAHEVSSVVPEAVSGTKDAVDENNNPLYQGIDQSKLVPLLVKTIQELEARITTLENA